MVFAISGDSLTETTPIEFESFDGIKPEHDRTTNIVIVHGIGSHCIGYGDVLIHNLLDEFFDTVASKSLTDYYREYAAEQFKEFDSAKWDGKSHIQPMRRIVSPRPQPCSGNCARTWKEVTIDEFKVIDTGEDHESFVLAQDALCKTIHKASKTADPVSPHSGDDCYKLYVNRQPSADRSENPEYVTGFVRRKQISIDFHTVHLYELTWSPATRWIEQSLLRLENLNARNSRHWVNRQIKEIVNTGLVDALAYFSDSGVLINNNILQTFCLVVADARRLDHDYAFSCEPELLEDSKGYASSNDTFFISHSLGTRVIFDSLGLLAKGARNRPPSKGDENQGLIEMLMEKLDAIGVQVSDHYQSDPVFSDRVASATAEFARSTKSFFAMTNQIPLLSANLTSPFDRRSQDAGLGFRDFLELRAAGGSQGNNPEPLQIVSFHDPDDIFSYDMKCWYHQSVTRHLQQHTKLFGKLHPGGPRSITR